MNIREEGGTRVKATHAFKQVLPDLEQMGQLRQAAAVAVVDTHKRILLMRRVPDLGDDLVMPGGKFDPGENARGAGLRELWEEAGIRPEEPLLPLARYISPPESAGKRVPHDVHILITTNYNEAALPSPRVNSPGEMSGWGWYDPRDVLARAQTGEVPIAASSRYAIGRVQEYLTPGHREALLGGTFQHPERSDGLFEHALRAADVVYVGVTTDALAARHHGSATPVAPFEDRLYGVRARLADLGVLDNVVPFPLADRLGPKVLDTTPGVLVVHPNSLDGGKQFNEVRARRGLPRHEILEVAS